MPTVLLARFDDGICDEGELAELMETSVLMRVPEVERSRHVWTPARTERPRVLRVLRVNLQLMSKGDSLVLAVTSPGPSEGRTTVVSWPTRALSPTGDKVVAVDLDLRKPELHSYLSADREPGTVVFEALLCRPGTRTARRHRRSTTSATTGHMDAACSSCEDIKAGLDEVARLGGNARRAARPLRACGRDISESTLRQSTSSGRAVEICRPPSGTSPARAPSSSASCSAARPSTPRLRPQLALDVEP